LTTIFDFKTKYIAGQQCRRWRTKYEAEQLYTRLKLKYEDM